MRAQDLAPKEIVAELDRYVVGQGKAKRAVAIALRNRWRRQKVAPELRDEILPKNIVMIGPTGVGKTEIARRLARLAGAPFVKVEASKFTEVGYVGRDVESMVRDLVELAVDMVREERLDEVHEKAEQNARDRVVDVPFDRPVMNQEQVRDSTEAPESLRFIFSLTKWRSSGTTRSRPSHRRPVTTTIRCVSARNRFSAPLPLP